MLPVGDSDALIVEVDTDGSREIVLIDGGRNWEDGERIMRQLDAYYDNRIDHMVLSHIDAGHARGLLHIVESLEPEQIGQAWMPHLERHGADAHESVLMARRIAGRAESTAVRSMAEHVAASVQVTQELIHRLQERGISTDEALADGNNRIGPMEVVGPTADFFEECVAFYGDREMLDQVVEQGVSFRRGRGAAVGAAEADAVLREAEDDPETQKQASLLLMMEYEGDKYLFTGDAGRRAFARCPARDRLADLHWLKVPNHGSKHNLSPELLDLFHPALAYISSSGIGIDPHPDLITALQNRGAVIYTTAGSGNVWHRRGDVPPRKGFETRRPR
jgi:beta-lactamase superfamily II metal-dependent hydrolase